MPITCRCRPWPAWLSQLLVLCLLVLFCTPSSSSQPPTDSKHRDRDHSLPAPESTSEWGRAGWWQWMSAPAGRQAELRSSSLAADSNAAATAVAEGPAGLRPGGAADGAGESRQSGYDRLGRAPAKTSSSWWPYPLHRQWLGRDAVQQQAGQSSSQRRVLLSQPGSRDVAASGVAEQALDSSLRAQPLQQAAAVGSSISTAAAAATAQAPALAAQTGAGYLAMCLAVKDQNGDIREWVEHHLRLGASKIYIFDQNSSVPLNASIADYISAGRVWYRHFSRFGRRGTPPQLWVYQKCLKKWGRLHTWMAFLDADEFLVIRDGTPDLPALLADYEAFAGLAVNWVVFGSSGHIRRPAQGALGSYWRCLPAASMHNRHIKTIVQTRHAIGPIGAHHFRFERNRTAVLEDGLPVHWARSKRRSIRRIALHHYVIKSLEDYQAKMARGSAMQNHKPLSFFTAMDAKATANCTDAWRLGYAPADPAITSDGDEAIPAGLEQGVLAAAVAAEVQKSSAGAETTGPAGGVLQNDIMAEAGGLTSTAAAAQQHLGTAAAARGAIGPALPAAMSAGAKPVQQGAAESLVGSKRAAEGAAEGAGAGKQQARRARGSSMSRAGTDVSGASEGLGPSAGGGNPGPAPAPAPRLQRAASFG